MSRRSRALDVCVCIACSMSTHCIHEVEDGASARSARIVEVDEIEQGARRLFSQYVTWQQEQSESGGSTDYVGHMLKEHAKRIGPEGLPVLIRLADILWSSQAGNLGHVMDAIDAIDVQHGTHCYRELFLHDGTSQVTREVAIFNMVMSRRGKEIFDQLKDVGSDQCRVLRAANARRDILLFMLRCLDCYMPMSEWRWAGKAFAEFEQPLVPASEEDWNETRRQRIRRHGMDLDEDGRIIYTDTPYREARSPDGSDAAMPSEVERRDTE